MIKEIFSVRYTLVSMAAIAVWWMVAFKQPIAHEIAPQKKEIDSLKKTALNPYPLSTINREELHRALCGDTSLIIALLTSWELDAHLLERAGILGVKHLTEEEHFRSHLLARLLTSKEVLQHEADARVSFLVDDRGNPLDLTLQINRILPQTFFSAGILLSLDSEMITALPHGIRAQKQLYPNELTDSITANIDTTTREELMMMGPDVAIVAQHYSSPAMVETLRQMGIALYMHRNISSVEDIHETTHAFGHLVGRPLKAELMTLFMKAALNAIDNHALREDSFDISTALIVNYHTRFSLPGKKMLTYEFQNRLGASVDSSLTNVEWEIAISEEQILAANPKKLIIIAPEIPHIKKHVLSRPAIHHLLYDQGCQICFLNEEIQKTVSQYHVLAYYDLVNTIK